MGDGFFPHGPAGVGRHAPVPARGKGNGAHLGAVRHAVALELLTEETADEDAEAAADEVRLKFAAKGMFRQVQDFIRFRTVFNEVEEEKVVQVVRPKHIFRFLLNGAVVRRRQEFRADGSVVDVREGGCQFRG